jgi:hypothetical protein
MEGQKVRKSHYLENGLYLDTTTGKTYKPIGRCCICGAEYGIQIHHYIEQQRCKLDLQSKKTRTPKTLTQEQINEKQKLFEVCSICHNAIHNLTDKQFKNLFNLNRCDYLYK